MKKRGGFNKLCSLSPQLQEFVGEAEMSRPEVLFNQYRKLFSLFLYHVLFCLGASGTILLKLDFHSAF